MSDVFKIFEERIYSPDETICPANDYDSDTSMYFIASGLVSLKIKRCNLDLGEVGKG